MNIAEVCDRAEIRLLMDRYAVACDTCDWDAFRELFTADCELSGQTARAVTYFIAYHTTMDADGGEAMMVLGGFYKDRLVKQADSWRISERADLATWIGAPLPPRLSPPPPWYGTMNHHRPTLPES